MNLRMTSFIVSYMKNINENKQSNMIGKTAQVLQNQSLVIYTKPKIK